MHIYTYQTPPCLVLCLPSSKTTIKTNKGHASMGFKLHLPPQVRKQCQLQRRVANQRHPPNSGIKHLKSEECEYLQRNARPKT